MSPSNDQFTPDPDDYGPRIEVSDQRDMQVGVVRSYKRPTQGQTRWSGRMGIYATGDMLLEVEVSLVESSRGEGSFVSYPSRTYQDGQGGTKYQKLVFFRGEGWGPAMQEAIERYMGGERGRVYTERDDTLRQERHLPPRTAEQVWDARGQRYMEEGR